MKTANNTAVNGDGRKKLPHDLLGQLTAKMFELCRRIEQGTLDCWKVINQLQWVIEGRVLENKKWREQNGIIYFSVTSDGTTGQEWIQRLKEKGFRIGEYADRILLSTDFMATSGITTEIAILKCSLFEDKDRINSKVRAFAHKRKLTAPNAEVACLMREMFCDEEIEMMGLQWIVVMHEPFEDHIGKPDLLSVRNGIRRVTGTRYLEACNELGVKWQSDDGFVFAVSQVDSKKPTA